MGHGLPASAGDEVWVANGKYLRRSDTDTVLLTMKEGVAAYGGFAGGETSRDARDLATSATVLDGDADGDGVGDVLHVVVGASRSRLDGFVLARGNATVGSGAGMLNYNVTDLTVANCMLFSNAGSSRGGAMYNGGAVGLRVVNCVFADNSAVESGGAMRNESRSSPEVVNCTFSGNSADLGGAICNYGRSFPVLMNCILWGDTAGTEGPEIHNEGVSSGCAVTYSCVQGGYEGVANFGEAEELIAALEAKATLESSGTRATVSRHT